MDTSKFLTHFLLKGSIFLIKDVGISIIVGDYFLNISEILNKSTDYPLSFTDSFKIFDRKFVKHLFRLRANLMAPKNRVLQV